MTFIFIYAILFLKSANGKIGRGLAPRGARWLELGYDIVRVIGTPLQNEFQRGLDKDHIGT